MHADFCRWFCTNLLKQKDLPTLVTNLCKIEDRNSADIEKNDVFSPLLFLSDQIDLWTFNSTGCECPDSRTSQGGKKTCPCCVSNGCPCRGGSRSSNRCGQCGLEQFCDDSKPFSTTSCHFPAFQSQNDFK